MFGSGCIHKHNNSSIAHSRFGGRRGEELIWVGSLLYERGKGKKGEEGAMVSRIGKWGATPITRVGKGIIG